MPGNHKTQGGSDMYMVSRLTNAIYKGDIENFRKFLTESSVVINSHDQSGLTPLHATVRANCFEAVDLLLQLPNINPNVVDNDNETSLFMALKGNADVRIVEKLMSTDFDVNARDVRKRTYLHVCTKSSYAKFAEVFIKRGADVDAVDVAGLTPLQEAVRAGNLNYVQMLLYYKADATAKCFRYGSTAFKKALEVKSLEIAYELLNYEVDFNDNLTFTLAMMCDHTLAEEMLNRNFEIHPENYKLIHDTIMHGNRRIFNKIWPALDKRILLVPSDEFLVEYLAMCTYTDYEWLQCLYVILSCEVASELVVDNSRNNVFSLLQAFQLRSLEKSERVKIIYLFLSLGLPVEFNDVLKFHKELGYDEEFEAIVYMDVPLVPSYHACFPGFFGTYIGANVDETLGYLIRRDCFCNFFEIRNYLKAILGMVNFCTIRKDLKDEYFAKNVVKSCNDANRVVELTELHNEIVKCFDDMDEVPSLLELSRNCVRYFIDEKAFLKKPSYYNTFLNGLKFPNFLKDIIRFKRPIYKRPTIVNIM